MSVSSLAKNIVQTETEIAELENSKLQLDKKKHAAVLNENYEVAMAITTEITELEDTIKKKRSLLDTLRKQAVNSTSEDTTGNTAKQLLLEKHELKKQELMKLKQASVVNEDYDRAEYYKAEISKLDTTLQEELERLSIHTMRQQASPLTATKPREVIKPKKQLSQDSRLYDSARSGRLNDVKKFLEQDKMDINSIDFNTGNCALHAAVMHKQSALIEYLVSKGADCNIKNRRGQSPLHLSIESRSDDMTKLLIEKGDADPYLKDNQGKTPYDLAAFAPMYQAELKDFLWHLQQSKATEIPQVEQPKEDKVGAEQLQIYLRSGGYYTFVITEKHTASDAVSMMANKLAIPDVIPHLEVTEEVMGKERKLKETEFLLESRDKWPNTNPLYCKFFVKLVRGAPGPIQMRFRDAIYGGAK